MRLHLRTLFTDTVKYGIAGSINQLTPLLLIPIYGLFFTPGELGDVALVGSLILLINGIFVFGLDSAVTRLYWSTKSKKEKLVIFNSWIISYLIITLIGSLIVYLILIKTKYYEINIIIIIISIIILKSSQIIANCWYRTIKRPKLLIYFNLIYSLSLFSITYIFLFINKLNINSIFLSQAVAALISYIYLIFTVKRWISPKKTNIHKVLSLFKLGIPLVPVSVLLWLSNYGDSWIIKEITNNMSWVGIYYYASLIGIPITFISLSFQQAWGPFALSILKIHNAKLVYSNTLTLFVSITSILILILSLFLKDILNYIANESYEDIEILIILYSFSQTIFGIYYIAALGTYIKNKNINILYSVTLGVLFKIIFIYLFIDSIQIYAIPLASLLCNILICMYLFKKSQEIYFIPYKFKKCSFILLGSLFFSIFLANTILDGYLKFIICLIFMLLLVKILIKNYERVN